MSSWNDSVHFYNWIGVTCSPSSKQVTILDLEVKRLVGPIPPSTGNFNCLTGINLWSNSFNGEIPREVGRLQCLHHLNLSRNSFGGKLPTNLSYCTKLKSAWRCLQQSCWANSKPPQLIVKVGESESWYEQPNRNYPSLDRKLFFFVYS